jgi:hypothetical protein
MPLRTPSSAGRGPRSHDHCPSLTPYSAFPPWEDTPYDWALEFDAKMKDLILAGDHKAIVDCSKLGRSARLAVPTLEHYLPRLQDVDACVSPHGD